MNNILQPLLVLSLYLIASLVQAASPEEIDTKVDATIEIFNQKVSGGEEFLNNAKGILVFPSVIKAGFVFGGEYGEGALRIKGKVVDYYRTTGASFGFQFGAQSKSIIIVFLDDKALLKFRQSRGWEAGVDGSIAIATTGAGGSLDTRNMSSPIVGFVFGNKGLMVDLSLKGSKYSRMKN